MAIAKKQRLLADPRQAKPTVNLLAEVQFTATAVPAHLVKNLMQDIEPPATVANGAVVNGGVFRGFGATTGRFEPFALVGNNPPVTARTHGVAHGNDFLGI